MTATRLCADCRPEEVAAALEEQGYCIVEGWMGAERLAALRQDFAPHLEGASSINEDFGGKNTKRFGALLAKSPQTAALAVDPLLLAVADAVLLPHCAAYQINYTGVASLEPGEKAQVLHRDSGLYPFLNPAPPVILSTVWAVTDFSAANGGTQLVPGSHRWPEARQAEPAEVINAEMPAGSCLFYLGNVIHGGGANRSNGPRTGVLLQYSLGWLRQEENQYLAVPAEIARTLPPRLQRLMGYAFGGINLGMVDRKDPFEVLNGTVPAEGSRLFPEDLVEADAKVRLMHLADPQQT